MQTKLDGADELVEVALVASRILIGVAERSLPDGADVTIHQFRALAILAAHDELNVNSLAELLGVSPSTVTRLCDRLVRKNLIRRRPAKESRREVCLTVSPSGAALVGDALERRREAIAAIVANMPALARGPLAEGLKALVEATGAEAEAPRRLA